jgi:hypothetical protein
MIARLGRTISALEAVRDNLAVGADSRPNTACDGK